MKRERWGSLLVQEKYREEKACDRDIHIVIAIVIIIIIIIIIIIVFVVVVVTLKSEKRNKMAHNSDNRKQEGKYFLRKFLSKANIREAKIGD